MNGKTLQDGVRRSLFTQPSENLRVAMKETNTDNTTQQSTILALKNDRVDSTPTSSPISSNVHMSKEADVFPDETLSPTYPEGGLRAYLVVFGSFCAMTAGFGLTNIVGVFQAYLSTHQLSGYPLGTIGWIFGIYVFLAFFCGAQIGPIFDAKGPRWLVFVGSILLVGGMFGVAESKGMSLLQYMLANIRVPSSDAGNRCHVWSVRAVGCGTSGCLAETNSRAACFGCDIADHCFAAYWHFILTFSILCGLGTSLLFTPAVSAIAHFFYAQRGTFTGFATTGGSIGGIVFPLALQRLFPTVGYAWSVRIMAFIFLFLCIVANLLIRSRLPPKKGGSVWPDFRIFKDSVFALTTAGVFFLEWGLFIPLTFMSSYALDHGIDPAFSFQLLAILSVGSFFGRWGPGFIADKAGRFNTMIITITLCIIFGLGVWLPANGNLAALVIFALGFGFASGSNISLTPVCVGQLCDTEEYGKYYATAYSVVSFG